MATEVDSGPLRRTQGGRGRYSLALVSALIVLGLTVAVGVQWRQLQLLNQSVAYQDDYLVVNVQQLEAEQLRLRSAWQAALAGEADLTQLRLRYDIFVSRTYLLDQPSTQRLLGRADDLAEARRATQRFIDGADASLGPDAWSEPTSAELRRVFGLLQGLEAPLRVIAVEAAHRVSQQLAERNWVVRQHTMVALTLTALLCLSTFAMAFALRQLWRQARERRKELERMTVHLSEARAIAEDANSAKSAFLANMSHEIRTPFHGVLGMLSLLKESPLDECQRRHVQTATDSAQHLLTILNDILDVSKLESGSLKLVPEPTDLRSLVSDVELLMRSAATAKGLSFTTEVAADIPVRALADATRCKQVLFNLMSNAVKFTHRGSVSLQLQRGDGTAQLRFTVSDTGIGISPATQQRLFRRFSQGDDSASRRYGGSGLGLEISRNLARMMGGDITLESSPGVGSRFHFTLQVVPMEPALHQPQQVVGRSGPTDRSPTSRNALNVLVVEDHIINRLYISTVLERLGDQAVFAENGREALQAMAGHSFDVVLMDLHMPEMDGIEATRAIRAMEGGAGRTPVVMLTADAFDDTRARCMEAGADHFLAKPVVPDDLRTLLHQLGRRAPGL